MPDIKLTGKSRRWEKRAGALEAKVQGMGKFLDVFDEISDNLSEPLKKQVGALSNIQENQKGRLKIMENAVRLEQMIHKDVGELTKLTDVFRQGIKDASGAMKDLTMGILESFDDILDTFLGPLWRFTKKLIGGLGIFGGRLFKVTIGKWFFGMGKKEADVGKKQTEVLIDVRDELYRQLKTNPNLGEHIMSMDESLKGVVGFQPEMMRFLQLMGEENKDIQYFWKENRELEEEAEDVRHKTLIETLRNLGEDIADKTGGLFSKILAATGIKKLYEKLMGKGVAKPAPGAKGKGWLPRIGIFGGLGAVMTKVGVAALWTAVITPFLAVLGVDFERGFKKGGIQGGMIELLTSWVSPLGFILRAFFPKDLQEEFKKGLVLLMSDIKNFFGGLEDLSKWLKDFYKELKEIDFKGMAEKLLEGVKKLWPGFTKKWGEFTSELDVFFEHLREELYTNLWAWRPTKYIGPGEGFWSDLKIDFDAAIEQWKNFFKGIIKWIADTPYAMYKSLRIEVADIGGMKGNILKGIVGAMAPNWEARFRGEEEYEKKWRDRMLNPEAVETKPKTVPGWMPTKETIPGIVELTTAVKELKKSTDKLRDKNEELRKKKPEEGRSNFIGLGGTEGDGLNIFRAMGAMQ